MVGDKLLCWSSPPRSEYYYMWFKVQTSNRYSRMSRMNFANFTLIMSLLKCIAEFTGGWKEIFGKVCVSASLAKSRPTWYISAALHTQRTTQRQGNRQMFLKASFLFAAIHWLSTQQSFVQVLEMSLCRRVLCILYSDPAELCVFFEMQQSSVFVPRSPRAFFPSCTSLSYV